MTNETCGTVRELIPDAVGARLSASDLEAVQRHVADCAECGAELLLARVVFQGRPPVPTGLLDRLLASVGAERGRPPRTWWHVSAAAVAALALGIGISSEPVADAPVPGYAYEIEEGDIWVSDDGLLAGAPLFEELSDAALLQLLDELSVDAAGGSA